MTVGYSYGRVHAISKFLYSFIFSGHYIIALHRVVLIVLFYCYILYDITVCIVYKVQLHKPIAGFVFDPNIKRLFLREPTMDNYVHLDNNNKVCAYYIFTVNES